MREPIFEHTLHKQMWDYVVEEINKMEYGKEMKYKYVGDITVHYFEQHDYKSSMRCFACEYAYQVTHSNTVYFCTRCSNCPFEGVNPDTACINHAFDVLSITYRAMCKSYNASHFNSFKQMCIQCATIIRDWSVKDSVKCK